MLDLFLSAVYEKTKEASLREELVSTMKKLPNEELLKIATGELKVAYYDGDDCWLDKFKDTPLYQEALALEEACLQLEIQSAEKRLQETDQIDMVMKQKDAIRIKKRLLELELRRQQMASAGTEPAMTEDAPHGEMPAASVEVKHKAPPGQPAPPAEKMASAVEEFAAAHRAELVASMRKEAASYADDYKDPVLRSKAQAVDAAADEYTQAHGPTIRGARVGALVGGAAGGLGAGLATKSVPAGVGGALLGALGGGALGSHVMKGKLGPEAAGADERYIQAFQELRDAERAREPAPKPPITHRVGEAVGRHADVAGGLLTGVPLGLGTAANMLLSGSDAGPAALAGLGAGAGGYLLGRGATRFGQGVASGMAHAHPHKETKARYEEKTASEADKAKVQSAIAKKYPNMVKDREKVASMRMEAALMKQANLGAVVAPFAQLGKGAVNAVKGAGGLGQAAKNLGAMGMSWAKQNPLHAAGAAGAAGLGAGAMMG